MFGWLKKILCSETVVTHKEIQTIRHVHEHVYKDERRHDEPPPRQHGSSVKNTDLGSWN
jgi:hypothetical protein